MTDRIFKRESVARDAIMDYMIGHPWGTIPARIVDETGESRQAIHPQVRTLIDKGFLEWRDIIEEEDWRSSSFRIPQDKVAQSKWAEYYLSSGDVDQVVKYLKSEACTLFMGNPDEDLSETDVTVLANAVSKIVFGDLWREAKDHPKTKQRLKETLSVLGEDGFGLYYDSMKELYNQFGDQPPSHPNISKPVAERLVKDMPEDGPTSLKIANRHLLVRTLGANKRVIDEMRYMLRWSPDLLRMVYSRTFIAGPIASSMGFDSKKLKRFVANPAKAHRPEKREMRRFLWVFFHREFVSSMKELKLLWAASEHNKDLFERLTRIENAPDYV